MTTFQYDLQQIAVGVLYINLGLAASEFPTTTRAHPSHIVRVVLIRGFLLEGAHKALFPFDVRWDVWRDIVSPLFDDGSVLVKILGGGGGTLRNEIQRQHLLGGNISPLVNKIKEGIRALLVARGYVPPEHMDPRFVFHQQVRLAGKVDGSSFIRFDT